MLTKTLSSPARWTQRWMSGTAQIVQGTRAALMFIMLAGLLSACTYDNNTPESSSSTPSFPLVLLSHTTQSIATDASIVLQFSSTLNAGTVSSNNISLSGPTGTAPITFAVTGSALTIKPALPLSAFATYTLTVGTGVRGTGGETLPSAVALTFFTGSDGSPGAVELVAKVAATDGSEYLDNMDVAVDGNGNAIIVWVQHGYSSGSSSSASSASSSSYVASIYANRYVIGTGWGTPQLIGLNSGTDDVPDLAIDSSGNALVVWNHNDSDAGGGYAIYANQYSIASLTWQGAQQISATNAFAFSNPQVTFNPANVAIAVWSAYDGSSQSYGIFGNWYASGAWGTSQGIETSIGTLAVQPQIAFDAKGGVMLAWLGYENCDCGNTGYVFVINSKRYDGEVWGTTEVVSTGGADEYYYEPQLVVDVDGNALTSWERYDGKGSSSSLLASRYDVSSGWQTPIVLDDGSSGTAAQLAVDLDGNITAVWQHYDSVAGQYHVYANRYTNDAWAASLQLDTATDSAYNPSLAIDLLGNGYAAWEQYDVGSGDNLIYTTRYNATANSWSTGQAIQATSGYPYSPRVAAGTDGTVIAAWLDISDSGGESADSIYAARLN